MSPLRLRTRIIAAVASGLLICAALAMVVVGGLIGDSNGGAPALVGSVNRNEPALVPTSCHANAHHRCTPSTALATPAPT